MSAESGIKTFRDSDGLWENYRIEDVCTPEALERNPELVNHFYNERRKQLYEASLDLPEVSVLIGLFCTCRETKCCAQRH